jgi:NAD(P)-dependent dehydrogenase (short-subunit alcohol dehydrogenase family)
MRPQPRSGARDYAGCGKIRDKVALITGADSGIGRAVAVLFAKEGADVAIVYLNEHRDARETKRLLEAERLKCLLLAGDVGREEFCKDAAHQTSREFGRINILVNNAAEQHLQESITKITEKQLERTFRTNIFSMFFMTRAVIRISRMAEILSAPRQLPHTKAVPTCCIILQPKARSSPSLAPWPKRWRKRKFG